MSLVLNGTSQYAKLASALVSASPLFMTAWVKASSLGGGSSKFILSVTDGTTHNSTYKTVYYQIGSTAIVALDNNSGTSAMSVASNISTGVWTFVAGLLLSSISRTSWVGSSAGSTNTTSITPTGLTASMIGARLQPSGADLFWSGRIAQAAFWNIDQSANITNLAAGYAPNHYPSGLVAYLPLNGDLSDTIGNSWSNIGSASFDTADNPTMIGLGFQRNRLAGLGQLYVPSLDGV